VLFPKPVSGKVALPEPLRVDDRRRGNSFPTTGLTAGSEAQIIPVKTSMLDQMEAPTLSSAKCKIQFACWRWRLRGLHVGSRDLEMT
jgi:hypothetical protein